MNRAEMIKRIVGILTPPHPVTADAAAALIVDAVLPQITTAEELEALPRGRCVLMHSSGGVWIFSGEECDLDGEWRKMWRSLTGGWLPSSQLLADGPLTVVWQPS